MPLSSETLNRLTMGQRSLYDIKDWPVMWEDHFTDHTGCWVFVYVSQVGMTIADMARLLDRFQHSFLDYRLHTMNRLTVTYRVRIGAATPPVHPNAGAKELLPTIVPLLNEGYRWIDALKFIRAYTGWGLLQAKLFLDPYRNMSPAMRVKALDDLGFGKCQCGGCYGECEESNADNTN